MRNNYQPSLRQDARPVIRSTGAPAGAWFWGILLAINILFWPSIYVTGPHRLTTEWVWYCFIGVTVTLLALGSRTPKTKPPVPRWTPHPTRPDLRETDEFQGMR